ncbi:hypothetical protein TrVE_jg5072 [Triparma verrucosa]|uniref:Uncharacterized protein n=2 Tax=Triparma TaxID=722752 RepID=A0A9W7B8H1_9STRA|nr:hypothetical protein TrVE_jg5072 [Triparma verrucosa]GMH86076.1 hypothetical protein TrST_g2004 [Triparma strigata]
MSTQQPHGYLLAMPLLCLNMGVEMLYILSQRLSAQNVKQAKSQKVLQDVIRTMFSGTFITELFRPQEMYTSSSTRQIFNKLAHSSIMRINETSMDKLYDLMTMGVKHQFLKCNNPQQFLQCTYNHLSSIRAICEGSDCAKLVENTMVLLHRNYALMSPGNWCLLKQQISMFFQGRKVKVSLFLQSNTQAMDGTLSVDTTGRVGKGTDVPGTIRILKGPDRGKVKTFSSHSCNCEESGGEVFFDQQDHIGENVYQKEGKDAMYRDMEQFWIDSNQMGGLIEDSLLSAIGGETGSWPSGMGGGKIEEGKGQDDLHGDGAYNSLASSVRGGDSVDFASGRSSASPKQGRRASAAEEFNLLANLMGTAADETEEEMKPIKMSFDNFISIGDDEEEDGVRTVVFDGAGMKETVDQRFERMGFDDAGDEEAKAEGKSDDEDSDSGDDLLDLMDSAK